MENRLTRWVSDITRMNPEPKGLSFTVYTHCRRSSCLKMSAEDRDKYPQAAFVTTHFVSRKEFNLIQRGKLLLQCGKCHQPADTFGPDQAGSIW